MATVTTDPWYFYYYHRPVSRSCELWHRARALTEGHYTPPVEAWLAKDGLGFTPCPRCAGGSVYAILDDHPAAYIQPPHSSIASVLARYVGAIQDSLSQGLPSRSPGPFRAGQDAGRLPPIPGTPDADALTFFRSFYVERPQVANVIRRSRAPGVTYLVGPRGSGKTTILRRAAQDLRTTSSDPGAAPSIVVPIDVLSSIDDLRSYASTPAGADDGICMLVYTELRDFILTTVAGAGLREAWRAQQLTADRHDLLPDELLADAASRNPVALLRAAEADPARYGGLLGERRAQWRERTFRSRLTSLLAFLESHLPDRVVVIIDNVDQLPAETHGTLNRRILQMASTRQNTTWLLAVRDVNLWRFRVDRDPADVEVIDVETSERFFETFLTRRFDIARREARNVGRQPGIGRYGHEEFASFGFADSDEFVTELTARATETLRLIKTQNLVLTLIDWCNGSLRDAARLVATLVSHLALSDSNFYVPDKKLKDYTQQRTAASTLIHRAAIWGSVSTIDPMPRVVNVFTPLTLSTSRAHVAVPAMRILELLRSQPDCTMDLTDFREHLQQTLGVTSAQLQSLVWKLLGGPASEVGRMIDISGRYEALKADWPPDDAMNIGLTPRGRAFVDRFSLTCEYVAWMAGLTPLSPAARRSFEHHYRADITADPVRRLTIATRFVCRVLDPLFTRERTSWKAAGDYAYITTWRGTALDPMTWDDAMAALGVTHLGGLYPSRAAGRLLGFAGTVDSEEPEFIEARDELKRFLGETPS